MINVLYLAAKNRQLDLFKQREPSVSNVDSLSSDVTSMYLSDNVEKASNLSCSEFSLASQNAVGQPTCSSSDDACYTNVETHSVSDIPTDECADTTKFSASSQAAVADSEAISDPVDSFNSITATAHSSAEGSEASSTSHDRVPRVTCLTRKDSDSLNRLHHILQLRMKSDTFSVTEAPHRPSFASFDETLLESIGEYQEDDVRKLDSSKLFDPSEFVIIKTQIGDNDELSPFVVLSISAKRCGIKMSLEESAVEDKFRCCISLAGLCVGDAISNTPLDAQIAAAGMAVGCLSVVCPTIVLKDVTRQMVIEDAFTPAQVREFRYLESLYLILVITCLEMVGLVSQSADLLER
jgi:hypothetical protein